MTFGKGWSTATWGSVNGLVGCEESIGTQAEVYARRYDGRALHVRDWYTLEGSPSYFVRLRPSSGAGQAGQRLGGARAEVMETVRPS